MPDLITLTCPTCGAKLKVTDQIHLLACRNCGNEHMVVRDVSSIYLAPIAQDVRGIRVGVDKTAAELAVARLTPEVATLERQLNEAKKRTNNEWIAPDNLEKFLPYGLGTSLFFSCGALSNDSVLGTLFVVAAAASLVGLVMVNQRRMQRVNQLKTATIERLTAQLKEKSTALARNRNLVDG